MKNHIKIIYNKPSIRMPETVIVPRSETFPSSKINNDIEEEKPKRQGSQLPIRCQENQTNPYRRFVKSSLQLRNLSRNQRQRIQINPVRSCPNRINANTKTFIPKKLHFTHFLNRSSSMIELPCALAEFQIRSDNNTSRGRLESGSGDNMENDILKCRDLVPVGPKLWLDEMKCSRTDEKGIENPNFLDDTRAAALICHALVINAWRRRRYEIIHLHQINHQLSQQITHLNIQIMVLRRLLNKENNRTSNLTVEIGRMKSKHEEVSQKCDSLTTEKIKFERELETAQDNLRIRTEGIENLKNELFTANNRLEALDVQLSRERDKVLRLRDDKQVLSDKMTTVETLVVDFTKRIHFLDAEVEELKLKLINENQLYLSSKELNHQYVKELKENEEHTRKLEKLLDNSDKKGQHLNSRVNDLENRLADQEVACRRIEAAYNLQSTELNELRDHFIRRAQGRRWSSRMLQLAETFAWAPRIILRSLWYISGPNAI